jgi:hypothetical protein
VITAIIEITRIVESPRWSQTLLPRGGCAEDLTAAAVTFDRSRVVNSNVTSLIPTLIHLSRRFLSAEVDKNQLKLLVVATMGLIHPALVFGPLYIEYHLLRCGGTSKKPIPCQL